MYDPPDLRLVFENLLQHGEQRGELFGGGEGIQFDALGEAAPGQARPVLHARARDVLVGVHLQIPLAVKTVHVLDSKRV